MRSARRVRTTLASAARAKAEEITRRVLRGRAMSRLAVVPTSKGSDHGYGGPKSRNKSLAARYLEVLRLRERVLEAEHNGNSR
jgi:hypothetical protein